VLFKFSHLKCLVHLFSSAPVPDLPHLFFSLESTDPGGYFFSYCFFPRRPRTFFFCTFTDEVQPPLLPTVPHPSQKLPISHTGSLSSTLAVFSVPFPFTSCGPVLHLPFNGFNPYEFCRCFPPLFVLPLSFSRGRVSHRVPFPSRFFFFGAGPLLPHAFEAHLISPPPRWSRNLPFPS